MKSKKIIFAFVFLLQIHGASAGQSDKKIDTNKDPVEKRDELDQQSPKAQKEMTLDDLLHSARVAEDAHKPQEEQKFDRPAEGDQNQDFASSPSQSNVDKSYEGEGGEYQMHDSYGTPEVVYEYNEYKGSVFSYSQSDVGRGRGEEEGRGSITSLDAQNDRDLKTPDTLRCIIRVCADQELRKREVKSQYKEALRLSRVSDQRANVQADNAFASFGGGQETKPQDGDEGNEESAVLPFLSKSSHSRDSEEEKK